MRETTSLKVNLVSKKRQTQLPHLIINKLFFNNIYAQQFEDVVNRNFVHLKAKK